MSETVKPDFNDWMSGRYWLKDKAPKEGFYGRYTEDELALIRVGFDSGANNSNVPTEYWVGTDANVKYLLKWSYEIGQDFFRKFNNG